ncbi:WxcM-like domain-containing protein [Soonwooa sp.]|uniref:WxcM-like domain-containing protein n=1 Tax=Soonwooa sp. TaxID=1938592 RepID=UPI0026016998|nr:WxcM-like domain-containing protein [Soonwooa sp.]
MLIQGNEFIDHRGKLRFNNDLDLSEVKRMYVIENQDTNVVRAWQAHKIEKRWFVAVEGQFEIKLIELDDFNSPSDNLEVVKFTLKAETMDCLCIQPGYATSIHALCDNAKLVVFANYRLGEIDDNYKFDSQKWR